MSDLLGWHQFPQVHRKLALLEVTVNVKGPAADQARHAPLASLFAASCICIYMV